MFKKLDILDEKNKILRQISKEVTFPLSKEDKDTIEQMVKHLKYSQIEEYEKKYDLRPGMGLAFPQLGMLKRIIVIVYEYEEGKFEDYVVVNPKIISNSKEIIAADVGEGCLIVMLKDMFQDLLELPLKVMMLMEIKLEFVLEKIYQLPFNMKLTI